jgi:putative hemolysin
MLIADILILIICLTLYAFFSGMETAFYAANRLRIELSHQQGSSQARILSKYFHNPTSFIITCLIGNTIVAVILALWLSHHIIPWLLPALGTIGAIIINIAIITSILVLSAEFLPKTIFRVYADKVLPFFAKPFNVVYILFRPIAIAVEAAGKGLLRLAFRHPFTTDDTRFSMEELEHIIKGHSEDEQHDNEIDAELFESALEFRHLKVRDCMVPRADIVSISIDSTIEALLNLIIQSNHSRILVYRDNPDNLIGYVHHFDLHKAPKDIASILISIRSVQETLGLDALLRHFIRTRKNIAIVADEEDKIIGIITMEDILEEIFGEIEDEYDNAELVEQLIDTGHFLFSARLEIDYLNKKYGLDLPEIEEQETLSDLVIFLSEGVVPPLGSRIDQGGYAFIVKEVSETRVEMVEVLKLMSGDVQ